MSIEVRTLDERSFRVVVQGGARTEHEVTVDPAYAARISAGEALPDLVRRSFEFLLEREPNTSILSRFDLTVIARYFPEYEQLIGLRD